MAMSISNQNFYIYSVLSNRSIKIKDLTIESIDGYFSYLLDNVKAYILEQQFDIVFDLFEEMITSEVELKSNQDEKLVFNNMDYHKILLYEFHSLQVRIIDLLLEEIQHAKLDYENLKQFSSTLANGMKEFTFSKFNSFIEKLRYLKFIDDAVIDRYIQIITQQLQTL